MSQQSQPAARWALLIGIDRYSRLGKSAQLSGCVNDVRVMAQLLVDQFGFPADHVIQLIDCEAKREAILAALDGLVARAGSGDAVVVHYSGHGSQARSLDAAEVDGWDETILPHDTGRSAEFPNLDIHDKEIHAWLERLTAVTQNVTLIFDSCHSGGITRDAVGEAAGAKARWVPPDPRPPDPSLVAAWSRSAPRSRREIGPSGWLPLGRRYVLLAGCRSSESSYELPSAGHGEPPHGALTYFLSRQLKGAGPGTTFRDVYEAAAVEVTGNCSLQHPQLEGEGDRGLFGLERIEPMRYVPVRERSGEEVLLGAGAAMGASAGSTWAVYPPGAKQAGDGSACLGTVAISAVGSVTSRGRIVGEDHSGAVVAGSRAIELIHDHGDFTLAVRIVAPHEANQGRAELTGAIASSQVLRLAREGEPAGATIYLLPPRRQATAGDPVPQAVPLEEATWAVVGKAGELILPLCAAGPDAPGRLRDNLEKRARFAVALAIQNPGGRLRGAIDCVLLRQRQDGEWAAATADAGGLPVFTAGERLALELINRSPGPLYLYVLDFGLTGRVEAVYPIAGIDEPLPGGGSVRVGTCPSEAMDLVVPPEFPFLPPASPAEAVEKETLKVIATTSQTDFRVLLQDGFRARSVRRQGTSALDLLLDMAAGGPTRDFRVQSRPAEEDWTTIERSFWLRPDPARGRSTERAALGSA